MQPILTPTSLCRFGMARGDITPPVGMYHRMWGAALHDRSEGIHQPLTATALSFRSSDPSAPESAHQLVIALDHCLLGRAEMEALLGAIERRAGVGRDRVVVTFSHTHAAGLMSLDRVDQPGGELIPAYLERVNETVADLAAAARRNEAAAAIAYGFGRCNLAVHRDQWDEASGQWVCGFQPAIPADDTVLVARVTNAAGQTIAGLVNYACHPTTLAWDNRLISPDYPGAMRETVERELGATCVFLQGTSGELGPKHGYVGDVQVAEQNGRQLGYAALSALAALPPAQTQFEYVGPVVSGATIGVWKYVATGDDRRKMCTQWTSSRAPLRLPYRSGLPTLAEAESARRHWLAEEAAAIQAGDDARRRDARAMAERQTRMVGRLKLLPEGDHFPYQLAVWRMGDAVWVATQGEPYSLLQTSLRRSFPQVPIVVASLANGWGPSYLPPVELYGRGIYQESIALLAPGSLEHVIAEAATRIEQLLGEPQATVLA